MKRFISSIAITALLLSNAATAFASLNAQNIPGDADVFIEIKPQAENPFTALIKAKLNKTKESPFAGPENLIAETILKSQSTVVAFKYTDNNPNGFVLIETTPEKYNKFTQDLVAAHQKVEDYFNKLPSPEAIEIPAISEDVTDELKVEAAEVEVAKKAEKIKIELKKEDFEGTEIKTINNTSFAFVKNKYIIFADSDKTTKAVISWLKNNSPKSLKTNPNYRSIESSFLDKSFINVYVSGAIYKKVANELPEIKEVEANIIDLFNGFGISMKQDGKMFEIASKVLLDEAAKKALNIYPEKFNFRSRFVEKFSRKDNILFVEQFNISGQLTDQFKVIAASEPNISMPTEAELAKLNEQLIQHLRITLEELEKITSQEMAVAVYDNQETLPGVTVAFNVTGQTDIAERLAASLENGALLATYTSKLELVEKTTTTIDGNKLNTIVVKMADAPEFGTQHITIGVVRNNLIISTDKNLAKHYQGQITSKIQDDKINSILHFNLQSIPAMVKKIMIAAKENKTQTETTHEILDVIIAPFGSATFIGYADKESASVVGDWEIDIEKFKAYETALPMLLMGGSSHEIEPFEEDFPPMNLDSPKAFCDHDQIDPENIEAIKSLHYAGIISGEKDNCFYPNRKVSRAEFITMVDRAFGLAPIEEGEITFQDIEADGWYSQSVQRAVENKLIKGYEDNTFRPHAKINKAEALEILRRVTTKLYTEDTKEMELKFTDVNKEDWFHSAAQCAVKKGLENNEATEFAPFSKPTRQEAAKMIHTIINSSY